AHQRRLRPRRRRHRRGRPGQSSDRSARGVPRAQRSMTRAQEDNMFDLTGKVALITGSSRGIGKAIAEAMARQGARVVISSRKAEACARVAAAIVADGGEAIALPCNISHKDQLQKLVDDTLSHWDRIDIL